MTWDNLVSFLKAARFVVDDQTALTCKELYPTWEDGIAVTVEERYQYKDKLYNVVQSHTTQEDWTPDITPAMWAVIDIQHTGTINDPIPAVSGMEYIKGKYYIDGDTIYLMNREGMTYGETIILNYTPSQLIGQYFEVVQ